MAEGQCDNIFQHLAAETDVRAVLKSIINGVVELDDEGLLERTLIDLLDDALEAQASDAVVQALLAEIVDLELVDNLRVVGAIKEQHEQLLLKLSSDAGGSEKCAQIIETIRANGQGWENFPECLPLHYRRAVTSNNTHIGQRKLRSIVHIASAASFDLALTHFQALTQQKLSQKHIDQVKAIFNPSVAAATAALPSRRQSTAKPKPQKRQRSYEPASDQPPASAKRPHLAEPTCTNRSGSNQPHSPPHAQSSTTDTTTDNDFIIINDTTMANANRQRTALPPTLTLVSAAAFIRTFAEDMESSQQKLSDAENQRDWTTKAVSEQEEQLSNAQEELKTLNNKLDEARSQCKPFRGTNARRASLLPSLALTLDPSSNVVEGNNEVVNVWSKQVTKGQEKTKARAESLEAAKEASKQAQLNLDALAKELQMKKDEASVTATDLFASVDLLAKLMGLFDMAD